MRLAPETLGALAPRVARPGYDREAQAVGIVHLGIGAFHRAHQAVFTDDALGAGDRDWAILGVSLRSPGVRDQLEPQGGLYTVTERGDGESATRLIGAVRGVLVAPEDPQAVVGAIADPATRIVSLTVTEKGYRLPGEGGGQDEAASGTIYDCLGRALARRRAARHAGLTLLSCDNLAENGQLLAGRLTQFLDRSDPSLARWFEAECACPSTMVDRIVPATTAEDLDRVEASIGLRDEGAVIAEPFSQWVIEDRFAGPRPRWESGGAQFVGDVRPWETAKLRMLNGAHSALAYLGLARGHGYVHEAMEDAAIRATVEGLMRDEAAPTVQGGIDTDAYADTLLARFANRNLPHRLAQIAMDGSQKISQRWLQTLAERRAEGRSCPNILEALAAWIAFVRGDGHAVDDPMGGQLASLWREAKRDGIVRALFGEGGLLAQHWTANDEDARMLDDWIRSSHRAEPRQHSPRL